MISVSLVYCCKRVLILISLSMIEKNSMKFHYLKKKKFPCHVNIEDITDGNYVHTKRICKYLKIINLGDYCSLCLKNALLLADKFENFQNMS